MKLKKLFVLSAFILMLASLPLLAQEAFPVDENFNGTALPDGWKVESVKGEQQWLLKSDGVNSYMELRNTGEQSLGFQSRLVTPVVDLSDFMEPVVLFSYRMDKWAGGCDSLVVQYRTSETDSWKSIGSSAIGQYASVWTQDTVYGLPLPSATYQLAFLGIDRLGRGIQIDNVVVRECPECTTPTITLYDITKHEAKLLWTDGGLDATAYQVRVNSSEVSESVLNDPDFEADVFDKTVDAGETRYIQLENLNLGAEYFVYIRTVCGREGSKYARYTFKTLNNVTVNWYESFNLKETGLNAMLESWYTFNSADLAVPFVNSASGEEVRGNYSPDKTTSLIFGTDNGNTMGNLDAGVLAYAITPEIIGAGLDECMLRFTAKCFNKTGWAEITLLAGSDPDVVGDEIFEKYTRIKTVKVFGRDGFQDVEIALKDCPAGAKHIAIVSDGAAKQGFAIDDLYVEKSAECAQAFDVDVVIPSSSQITVNWNSMGATAGEVMLTSEIVTDPDKIDEAKIIKTAKGNLPLTVDGLAPWTEGYVYARNTCGGGNGKWSAPVFVRTPEKMSGLPSVFDFEVEDKYDMTLNYKPEASGKSSNYILPKGMVALAMKGNSTATLEDEPSDCHLETSALGCLQAQPVAEEYVVFPELTDVENTRVVLWHYSKSGTQYFEVGLMGDVNDTASFETLDKIESVGKLWKRAAVDLRGHGAKGRFFAIKYISTSGTTHWIDDVEFKEIPDCNDPKDVTVEVDGENAKVSWNANGVTEWKVRVAADDVYDMLYDSSYDGWLLDETVKTAPTVSVSGLDAGENDYFVYFKPICAGESTDWTSAVKFETVCSGITALPYREDFESLGFSVTQTLSCYTIYESVAYEKKSFFQDNKEVASPLCFYDVGDMYLRIQTDTVLDNRPARYGYFILPELQVKDQSLKDVMLTMEVKGVVDGNGCFEVGVVPTPEDTAAFFPITQIKGSYGKTTVENVYFSKYTGTGGHIAIRTLTGMVCKYNIDNITIAGKSGCPKVSKLAAGNITGTTAELSWEGDVETEWDLVVSTKALSSDMLDEAIESGKTDDIVKFAGKKVKDNPYKLGQGLFYNTFYFFYVRAVCGGTSVGEWSDAGTFRTQCGVITAEEMGVTDFENYAETDIPACWTAGNYQDPETMGGEALQIPGVSVAQSHSGSNSLWIGAVKYSHTKFDNGSYLISPEIKTDKISGLQMSFWGYADADITGASLGRVRVGVVTDEEDLVTFVESEVVCNYGQWYHYTVPFDKYVCDMNGEQGKRVMLMVDFPIKGEFYLDDVTFSKIPVCAPPAHVVIDSVGTDYARISWAKGSGPYTVRLSETQLGYDQLNTLSEDDGLGLVSFENVTDTFIEMKDLAKRTQYFVYVGSECADTMLWSNVGEFITACVAEYPVPYTGHFEDVMFTGEYSGPDCWDNFYGEERIWFKKCNLVSGGHNGGNALNMVIGNAQHTSYAVMPKLSKPVNELLVSFYAKMEDADEEGTKVKQTNVVVGVVSDMTSRETMKNTFVPVDTIFITEKGWNKYYVPLGGYTGSGEHIAFSGAFRYSLNMADKMNASIYLLDDVYVEDLPPCMFPEYLTVENVTPAEIGISFAELGSSANWQVACVKKGAAVPDNGVSVGSTSYTATNLEPGTDYDIYVRSVCDAAGGSVSPWRGPLTQRTAAKAPVEKDDYNYTEDFEGDVAVSWTFASTENANYWTSGTALANGEGSKSLYITDNGTAASFDPSAETVAWAYRSMNIEPGVYTFSYDWISGGKLFVGLIPAEGMFDGGSEDVWFADGEELPLSNFNGVMDGKNVLGGSTDETWRSVSDYLIIENDMAGYYHFVLVWSNTAAAGGETETPSAAVDNLKIERASCVQPMNLYVGRTLSSEADLVWEIVGEKSEYAEWEVYVTDKRALQSPDDDTDGTGKVFRKTFTDTRALIENLEELTAYYVFVRAKCASDGSYTSWSERLSFTTPCNPVEVGYVLGFDETPAQDDGIADCVTVDNIVGNEFYPTDMRVENTSVLARTKQGGYALKFSSVYGSDHGTYIALPHIKGSLDNVQLTFWMRPVPFEVKTGTVRISSPSLAEEGGAMAVTVAAMSDLKDTSTYTVISECTYPYDDDEIVKGVTRMAEDIYGNDWWVKHSVPLKGFDGHYILLHDMNAAKINNTIYIDSVSVEYMPSCVAPAGVVIDRVTDNTVEFSFPADGSGTWRYRCSTDPKMTDAITGEIKVPNGRIEGLKQASTYYISLCRVCDGVESEWSLNKKFDTDYSVRFDERFTAEVNVPDNWMLAEEMTAEALFDVPEIAWTYQDKSSQEGWVGVPVSNEASAHQRIRFTAGIANPYWLVSPSIYLDGQHNAYMTFDLMLTEADSYEPVAEGVENADATFMVLVSADGGKTWLEENATVWNANAGTDDLADFYELTNSFRSISIDLSEFKGKSIRVAFYTLPNVAADMDLHLDNVYINSYIVKEIRDNVCEETDYVFDQEDIVIRSDNYDMQDPQNNVFEFVKVSETDAPDNLYRFILNVSEMGKSEFFEEICAGTSYDANGFVNVTEGGTHYRKMAGTGNKCDSLATLHLTVRPFETKEFDAVFCAGGKYEWNGNTYTVAGDHTDTVMAVGDGCDTVVTLHLSSIPTINEARTHYLCEGESLTIDGRTLTSDGSWIEETVEERRVAATDEDCDTTITHTVVFAPKYNSVIEAAICDGETYNQNGFAVVAENSYTKTLKSALGGCDSILTLNLMVINPGETEREITRNITVEQLPYSFYGKEYDENTEVGTYTGEVTVASGSGACSIKVKYTLNVGEVEPLGTDNVKIGGLTLTPNPVRANESVTVHLDLTPEQREGLTVNVYSSTGALVDSFEPYAEPIVIDAFSSAGAYMVRIIDGSGNVYQGKVIVR